MREGPSPRNSPGPWSPIPHRPVLALPPPPGWRLLQSVLLDSEGPSGCARPCGGVDGARHPGLCWWGASPEVGASVGGVLS